MKNTGDLPKPVYWLLPKVDYKGGAENLARSFKSIADKAGKTVHLISTDYINDYGKWFFVKSKIVISSLWRSHIVALCYAKWHGVSWIITINNSGGSTNKKVLFIYRLSIKWCDFIVLDNPLCLDFIPSDYRYKVIIESMIPKSDAEFNFNKDCLRDIDYLVVQRFCNEKNSQYHIELIKIMSKLNSTLFFTLVFSATSNKNRSDIIESFKLFKNVNVLFDLPHLDIINLMMRSKFFIQLSKNEGLGLTLLESMQSKCQLIATPVSYITNKYGQSINIVTFEEMTKINDLASRLVSLQYTKNKTKIQETSFENVLLNEIY